MDASWRTQRDASRGGWQGCIVAEGLWSTKLCPDELTCAKKCAVDGLTLDDYMEKHGIEEVDDGVRVAYVSVTQYGVNVGSRLYMLDDGFKQYKVWKLKNREIAFDIDVSTLPCGVNAALYFVAMDSDGGKGIGNNDAGAKYGTGYCDARCQHSPNFMQGEANMDWANGACCMEVDLFEGNRESMATTMHTCSHVGFKKCTHDEQCGDSKEGYHYQGICDKDGCDYNPYRMGNHDFYGDGKKVDTSKPITVVTQFITTDGTDDGDLKEVRRIFMRGSVEIENPTSKISGVPGNSITDGYCNAQKKAFEQTRQEKSEGKYNQFGHLGGMAQLGKALDRGMVLAVSIWDDPGSHMRWLDSTSPKHHPNATGARRGPCRSDAGEPTAARRHGQRGYVEFTNLMYGEIGSTAKSKAKLQADFAAGPVDTAAATPALRRWSGATAAALAGSALIVMGLSGLGIARLQQRMRLRRTFTGARQQPLAEEAPESAAASLPE